MGSIRTKPGKKRILLTMELLIHFVPHKHKVEEDKDPQTLGILEFMNAFKQLDSGDRSNKEEPSFT